MKKYVLLFVLFFAIGAFSQNDTVDNPYWIAMMQDRSVNFYKTLRAYNLYYSNKPKLPQTGWKVFERWAHHASLIVNPDGSFPSPDHVRKEYYKFVKGKISTRSTTGTWTEVGPFGNPDASPTDYGIGRVSAIALHPIDTNKIYLGAPQGGFWRSSDKGLSWTCSTDSMPTLGVSAIVVIPNIIPSNPPIILIGTGDRDGADSDGLGVYKSTDGGLSFTVSNSGMGNVTVNKMLINPLNTNTIVAATDGGVFISYNQGASWVLKGSVVNMKDIQYRPGDSSILYGCSYNGSFGNGAFQRSTNGGSSWTTITSGFSGTSRNRMAIGVTAADPNIVYVVASKTSDHTLEGFYKSTDMGVSFTKSSTTTNILGGDLTGGTRGQGWYDLAIETSPTDANYVLVGGINLFRSPNGGANWTCVAHWYGAGGTQYVHADIHVLQRHPVTQQIFVGSDGGIDFSRDNGTKYNNINGNLAIRQFYHLDVSKQSYKRILAGAQDNGTILKKGNVWENMTGGDGMMPKISPLDSNKLISSSQYGNLNSSTDGGITWDYSINNADITESGPWVTPFALHPKVNDFMMVVYKNAWRSFNCFQSGGGNYDNTTSTETKFGSAVAFSQVSNNMCYIANYDNASGNTSMKRTNNVLVPFPSVPTWTSLNPSGSGAITSIATSYRDSNLLFITRGNKVYKSSNAGLTWTDISTGLPVIKMFSVVIDKYSDDRLYVGTQAGVYVKENGMNTWSLYNKGLPVNSEIRELVIWYDTICSNNSKITAATFGRGSWQSDLYSAQSPVVDFSVPTSACTGTSVSFTNNTTNNPDSFAWKITPASGVVFNGGTTANSASPNVTFNNPGTYSIELYARKTNFGYCSLKKTNIISIGNAGSLSLNHGDTTLCGGDTIQYTASGAVNYTWSPATGLSATSGAIVKVSPTATTTYTVISDMGSGVCPDTATFTATVQTAPGISKVGVNKICNGEDTKIIVTGGDTAFWNPSINMQLSPKGDTARVFPNSTVDYTIRVVKSGFCDVYLMHHMDVLPIPTYTFAKGKDTTICKGDSVLREVTSPTKIRWSPNYKLSRDTGSSVVIKTDVTQKYFVYTLDSALCPRADSFTITVNPTPSLVLSGPSEVCKGSTISLSAKGATSYSWFPTTYLDSANKANVNCKPDTDITYVVTASIGSCTQTASKSISVGSGPLVVKITGNTTVCSGASTKLKVTGGATYVWTPISVLSAGFGDSVWATPSVQNTKVLVTSSKKGCSGRDSVYLNMLSAPVLNVNVVGPTAFCAGDSTKLTVSGANTYQWSPSFGLSSTLAATTNAKPTLSTTYTVRGYNSNNCMGLDSVRLTVFPLPIVTVSPPVSTIYRGDSLTLTASGAATYLWRPAKYLSDTVSASVMSKPDSNIIYTVQGTSINNCKSSAIAIIYVLKRTNPPVGGVSTAGAQALAAIYPNPASDALYVEATETLEYAIVGMLGNVLQQGTVSQGKSTIDVQHITTGSYVMVLEDKQGNQYVEKLTIQK